MVNCFRYNYSPNRYVIDHEKHVTTDLTPPLVRNADYSTLCA